MVRAIDGGAKGQAVFDAMRKDEPDAEAKTADEPTKES
jgi:hypothetical protein